jgi:adenylyl cyclase CyaB, putative
MFEVELKIPLKRALAATTAAKLARQAEACAAAEEVDVYLAHPSRNFKLTDEALRIRRSGQATTLTYKGPKLRGEAKVREEIEVEIGSDKQAMQLFERLGFKEVATVRKTRRRFLLAGASVCLDEVEGLGHFLELELCCEQERIGEARRRLGELASGLGLDPAEAVSQSYLELLLARRPQAAEGMRK